MLDALLEVAPGERYSRLDGLRSPPTRVSGPAMIAALDRAAQVLGWGWVRWTRRWCRRGGWRSCRATVWRARPPLLRRDPQGRRLATLLATVVHLQAHAVDDALALLDVLISSKLLARAERESARQKVRVFPKLGRASITMATAMGVLLELTGASEDLQSQAEHDGVDADPVSLAQVWAQIEKVASRAELTRALLDIVELAGPGEEDTDAAWRAELVKRYPTVRPFLGLLCAVIRFGASPEGAPVLAALQDLPRLWGGGPQQGQRRRDRPEPADWLLEAPGPAPPRG